MPVAGSPVFERQNFRISTVIFGCAEYASEISVVFPDKRGLKIVYTRQLGKQPLISGSFCLTGARQAFRGGVCAIARGGMFRKCCRASKANARASLCYNREPLVRYDERPNSRERGGRWKSAKKRLPLRSHLPLLPQPSRLPYAVRQRAQLPRRAAPCRRGSGLRLRVSPARHSYSTPRSSCPSAS